MPIYEYRCEHCGHELEKLQRMSDAPLRDCPECGKPQLRRLVSAAGFRLKGGGWYETDFKKDNRRNLADGGKDSAARQGSSEKGAGKDGGASEKKSGAESKPAASKTKSDSGGQASAA